MLIGEGGFSTILQALLHDLSGLFASGHGNPVLAIPPLGCDDDLEAVNKSLCHIGGLRLPGALWRMDLGCRRCRRKLVTGGVRLPNHTRALRD